MDVEKGGVEKGEMGYLCTGQPTPVTSRNITGSISLSRRYEKVKKLIRALIRARFLTAIFALIMAFAFATGIGGTAFAAPGDIVGLADFATIGAVRSNTYTADLNGYGETYALQIVQLEEVSGGGAIPVGFSTAADALAVTWTQNTQNMANGFIDTGTYATVYSADISGYYLSVTAYNTVGSLGPDSWRATDGDGNTGDFSFVATVYGNPDSGSVSDIKIEFYDGAPTKYRAFATGSFEAVNGFDDYDSAIGDYGRSYPTPLDSVASGTLSQPAVISTYHKYLGFQNLQDIVDLSSVTHTPSSGEGWLYAVYYPDSQTPGQYNRDPISEIVGYDDYLLQKGALVIYAIGPYDTSAYAAYFPNTITRP
jgi:hypothetical protein